MYRVVGKGWGVMVIEALWMIPRARNVLEQALPPLAPPGGTQAARLSYSEAHG